MRQWFTKHPFVLIVLVCIIAYFPFFSAQFVWDDEQFIYANRFIVEGDVANILSQSITAGAGIVSDYFRPLTALSFAIDYGIWGPNPVAFRFINVAAHLLAGYVVYLLLKRLRASTLVATVIAGLFLLHPIQAEAVTYINARSNSFFALFGMLGLLCFTLTIQLTTKKISLWGIEYTISRPQLLLLSLLFYAMAVFSKETALSVIGLYVLIFGLHGVAFIKESTTQQTWWYRFTRYIAIQWQAAATLLVGFFLAFFYLYLRATVWNFDDTFSQVAFPDIYAQSLYVRLHTFTKVFFLYQQKLLIPYPLHMEYVIEPLTTWLSGWLVAFVIVIVAWLFFGWKELQRGNFWLLLGLLWYFAPLVPVSGIIPVNGIMYESWQYVPIIGWGMAWYGIYRALSRSIPLAKYRQAFLGIGLAVMVVYAGLVIRQNYFWSTPIRLYTYLLQYTESARIHNNLGMAYAEEGMFQEALEQYNRALDLGYSYPQIHHNMARVYESQGNTEAAITAYRKALDLNPDFYYSYTNFFLLLLERNSDEAAQFLNELQDINPEWAQALAASVAPNNIQFPKNSNNPTISD